MRNEPTPAENQLWQRLRKNQVHGYKFRRQHTIGVFIADFFCAQASLVVEVDGDIHEQQEEYDAMRQAYLESMGMRVLRFTNGEVMQQIDAVVERIGEVLLETEANPKYRIRNEQSNPTPASLRLASPPQSIEEGALKSPPDASGGDLEGGFWAFARAGKKLADIHLNYETYKQYPVQRVRKQGVKTNNRVEKMRPKNKRKMALATLMPLPDASVATDGKPLPDASGRGWGGVDNAEITVFDTLQYNESLTLTGIPEKAFAYRLGNRSALEWVIDQYQVKTDSRSGITSDPNGYSDDDQYIINLVERVIQVSVDTVDIVNQLAQWAFRE